MNGPFGGVRIRLGPWEFDLDTWRLGVDLA